MSFKKINLDMINNFSNRENRENYNLNRIHIKSPYNQKINNILDISPNNSIYNNDKSLPSNIYSKNMMTDEKIHDISDSINKMNYQQNKLEENKTSNNQNYNNYKKIVSHLNEENYFILGNNNIKDNKKNYLRNKANILNNYNSNHTNNSILSNNNNSLLNDFNNINFNTENMNNKFSNKIMSIKDENIDYIDFLKKQFETDVNIDNSNSKLESNNKELLKRCQDLIEDNRLLNTALNERTAKLNKIIQENLLYKSKIEDYKLIIQKNEQKIKFYEDQFNLFKNNNENYQKIINELKSQNDKLTMNMNKIQNENEFQNDKNFKNKLQDEITNIKNNLKNLYNIKNNNVVKKFDENHENESKIKQLSEEIKILKEKNNELNSKLEIINLDNNKLKNENKLYHNQIETYIQQINDLSVIIKNKDTLINALKEKEIENLDKEKIILTKSKSCSIMKFNNNNDQFWNENIKKLMNDNKENKLQIELLNDKFKSLDEIEKKYNAILNKKSIPSSDSSSLNKIDNNQQLIYTNKNNKYTNINNINEIIEQNEMKSSKIINELKENDKKLKEEKFELNERIKEYNLKLEEINSLNGKLKEDLNSKEKEIERLSKEIKDKDNIINALNKENNNFNINCENKNKEYEEQIKKLEIEKDQCIKEVNNLKNILEQNKNKTEFIQKEFDEYKQIVDDNMNKTNQNKNSEVENLKKLNLELFDQIKIIKEMNNNIINENNSLNEEIKELKKKIDEKDNNINELRIALVEKENNINEYKNKLIEKDNIIKELNEKMIEKGNVINILKKQIDEKENEIKDIKNKLKNNEESKSINLYEKEKNIINENNIKKEEIRTIPSFRGRFLRKKEEESKIKKNEKQNDIEQNITEKEYIGKKNIDECINENIINNNNEISKKDINEINIINKNENNKDIMKEKIINNDENDKNKINEISINNDINFDNIKIEKEVIENKESLNNKEKIIESKNFENNNEKNHNENNNEIKDNEEVKNIKIEENKEKIEIKEEKNDIKRDTDENFKIDIKENNTENLDNKIEENKIIHGTKLEEEKDEVKESIREMNRKKHYTHKVKNTNLVIDEINSEKKDVENLTNESGPKEENQIINYYLYGIDRNDYFHIFDINNRKWMDKKKIFELNLEEKSDTFLKDYQYEGTILYNTLEGVYILTGEKTDTLYYYNSYTSSISKICKFNNCHDNGALMYDSNENRLYVFGGKKIKSCEYYSFNDKQINSIPDLLTDRANASFIISDEKIFGFFGFSYEQNNYAKSIEYIDYNKKEQWFEVKDINLIKNDITFDIESISTMYYKHDKDKILIYAGIQGDEEDFVTEYYLVYDTKNNSFDKIKKWNLQQYKYMGKRWKFYSLKRSDQKGFHFAKNNRFLLMEKYSIEGYKDNDPIDILIDYKNNVHFILQEKEKIDIYRGNI